MNLIAKLKSEMRIGQVGLITLEQGLYSEIIIFKKDNSEKGATIIKREMGLGDVNAAIRDLKRAYPITKVARFELKK